MAEPDRKAVRERAQKLWEAAGRPQGHDNYFWTEAMWQLKEEKVRRQEDA